MRMTSWVYTAGYARSQGLDLWRCSRNCCMSARTCLAAEIAEKVKRFFFFYSATGTR